MCNVIIVDDEPVIRYGIRASIDWEKEKFHLLGEFANGEKALIAMKEQPVDILITDIKMPVMDGLILTKKALDLFPHLKVIMVSSYNDFEFVREGLKLGAVDYILKPTLEPENLLELVKKCRNLINEERDIEEKLDLVAQTTTQLERTIFEQELKRIILGEVSGTNPASVPSWIYDKYVLIYLVLNGVDELEQQFGFLYTSVILEEVQRKFYIETKEGVCFPTDKTSMLFVLPYQEDLVSRLKESIKKFIGLSVTIGYAEGTSLDSMKESYIRSWSACNRRFFEGLGGIYSFRDYQYRSNKKEKTSILKQLNLPYDQAKLEELLEERHKLWSKQQITPQEIKEEACQILTNLFINKVDPSIILEKCNQLKGTETLIELEEMLRAKIKACHELSEDFQLTSDNQLVEKALAFINEHYTEDLNLQKIADHIHISRNYFSIIFKKYMNQNFIDYVIHLRYKKAKSLIENTNYKVYEVAELSGFNDVKYFSKLFKKMSGFSPNEYRQGKHKIR
jgi:two-component system, response regulator YesN